MSAVALSRLWAYSFFEGYGLCVLRSQSIHQRFTVTLEIFNSFICIHVNMKLFMCKIIISVVSSDFPLRFQLSIEIGGQVVLRCSGQFGFSHIWSPAEANCT